MITFVQLAVAQSFFESTHKIIDVWNWSDPPHDTVDFDVDVFQKYTVLWKFMCRPL